MYNSAAERNKRTYRNRLFFSQRSARARFVRLTLRYLKWIMCCCCTRCTETYTIFGTAFQWRYSTTLVFFVSPLFCLSVSVFQSSAFLFAMTIGWSNALITRTEDSDAFFFLPLSLGYWDLMWISCVAHVFLHCECNRYRIPWKFVYLFFFVQARETQKKKTPSYLNVWSRETNCLVVLFGGLFNVLTQSYEMRQRTTICTHFSVWQTRVRIDVSQRILLVYSYGSFFLTIERCDWKKNKKREKIVQVVE